MQHIVVDASNCLPVSKLSFVRTEWLIIYSVCIYVGREIIWLDFFIASFSRFRSWFLKKLVHILTVINLRFHDINGTFQCLLVPIILISFISHNVDIILWVYCLLGIDFWWRGTSLFHFMLRPWQIIHYHLLFVLDSFFPFYS